MAFGVVEHHVARAVAVLPTEELSREREQLGLVGRDEQHLLRAPHEEVEVRTLRAVDHERKTAAAAHARLSLDGPPRARVTGGPWAIRECVKCYPARRITRGSSGGL